jgi:hypothetical protein
MFILLVGSACGPMAVRAQVKPTTNTDSNSNSNSNTDTLVIPFSDPGRAGTVQVKLFQGTVMITAHNRNDVTVTSRTRSTRNKLNGGPEAQGLRRLTSGFGVSEDNNVIQIGGGDFDRLDLDIQIPAKTNLKVESEVGGNVDVTGIEGDIEVTNLNGNIRLTDVSGSVVSHSTNGRVLVTMKNVTPQKPMAFTSVNGSVDVTLPPDTKGNLRLRTTNGDVYTDFDVQLTSPITPTVNRRGPPGPPITPGRPRPRGMEKSITGTINGGGPEFELRTVNGNVYIRKAK